VVLEKDGEDHSDLLCEKRSSITESEGGQEYPTYNKRGKANWISRNYRIKRVIPGRIRARARRSLDGHWKTGTVLLNGSAQDEAEPKTVRSLAGLLEA
jgi:hypothetical protein